MINMQHAGYYPYKLKQTDKEPLNIKIQLQIIQHNIDSGGKMRNEAIERRFNEAD